MDVRVIAATNKDLMELVEKGTFREDLYYRLAVLILELPPLKERIGDLRRLANFIVRKKSKALHRIIEPLSEEAVEQLRTIDWPGNVRQLANVLERAIVISPGRTITDKILADAMGSCRPFVRRPPQAIQPAEETPNAPLQDVERSAVLRALKECGGNRKQAALRLGISRSTLWRRLKEWE
ncbi:helix-turn-helix domain-containing protein [Bilophila wadsworthia]|uniref:helix-turn-helix domain-containing protein n=1 Tax=Bilophila wadsworthia TaxID=35833 RepID=UPI00267549D1|nr:helix-turn-helix domain-containing protein [Bilophila wadsworthia]